MSLAGGIDMFPQSERVKLGKSATVTLLSLSTAKM